MGRLFLIAEAGRDGGPIEPLLLTVLDLLRVGDGPGEICDSVSTVLSDSDGLGWRFLACRLSSLLSGALSAFSLPSSIMAKSDLTFGGVMSRLFTSFCGEAVVVGEIRLASLLVHPNDGCLGTWLLSPSGLTTCFFEFEVVICGKRDLLADSSCWPDVGIDEARAIGSRDMGRAILLF